MKEKNRMIELCRFCCFVTYLAFDHFGFSIFFSQNGKLFDETFSHIFTGDLCCFEGDVVLAMLEGNKGCPSPQATQDQEQGKRFVYWFSHDGLI